MPRQSLPNISCWGTLQYMIDVVTSKVWCQKRLKIERVFCLLRQLTCSKTTYFSIFSSFTDSSRISKKRNLPSLSSYRPEVYAQCTMVAVSYEGILEGFSRDALSSCDGMLHKGPPSKVGEGRKSIHPSFFFCLTYPFEFMFPYSSEFG